MPVHVADLGGNAVIVGRYEDEARLLLAERGRAEQVRSLRVDCGLTWRGVAHECQALWETAVGHGS